MAQLSVLGINIAKLVFHVVGMDDTGAVVLRKRLARSALLTFIANVPPLRIGMEACGSAHYWARRFREHGQDVRLIAPQFVKAYVKSPKNDARDAEAICEAVTRPTMRFVPIKRVEQQDLQALHRIRERLIKARTALVNEIRGLLNEYGMVLPQSIAKFRTSIVDKLREEQAKLTTLSTEVFWHLYDEFLAVEKRLAYDAEKLAAIGQAHPACQRLQTIPGIGPLSATALIAAVGDVTQFKNGRQLAAWLGLVPREHSTGGKPRLLGISKRGDRYWRKLLAHGARAGEVSAQLACHAYRGRVHAPHHQHRAWGSGGVYDRIGGYKGVPLTSSPPQGRYASRTSGPIETGESYYLLRLPGDEAACPGSIYFSRTSS